MPFVKVIQDMEHFIREDKSTNSTSKRSFTQKRYRNCEKKTYLELWKVLCFLLALGFYEELGFRMSSRGPQTNRSRENKEEKPESVQMNPNILTEESKHVSRSKLNENKG